MVSTPDEALALTAAVCALPGNNTYQADTEALARNNGIATAVAARNTPALYRWLMHGFSYQGISDAVAAGYINRHGNAEWETLAQALTGEGPCCPKLVSFEDYRGCNYRKTTPSCARPDLLGSCVVPALRLRKGSLNEQAYSLFLFIRDRCGGDLVGFIDQLIEQAAASAEPVVAGREALLSAFGEIQGVSRKLLSVMFAVLLIGADPSRAGWVAIGRSMVAVDSLVHNFLHRTGILGTYGASHLYGQRCYGERGCEAILRDLAGRIDARAINPEYPACFPRMVQHAVWQFCATGGLNVCNGRNINDDAACQQSSCVLWDRCARTPLRAGVAVAEAP